jgi:hypothetical protein
VGLQWRRRTSLVEPVAPTPSYSAARQGPHQPSNGLGVPDPDASQGPNGPLGPLVERLIQQYLPCCLHRVNLIDEIGVYKFLINFFLIQ